MEPSETMDEVPSSSRRAFVVFCIFGGGMSWWATSLAAMALPMYQPYFGLSLANDLQVGYNLGTLPWLLLLACRRRPSDLSGIRILLATQTLAVAVLCVATPGSPLFGSRALVLSQFLGGTCGYGAQFVCVPFLLRHENRLVAAFWLGDSASAVVCAAAAVAWRAAGWSLQSYMVILGPPTVFASALAFAHIRATGLGRLKHQFEPLPTVDDLPTEWLWRPLTLKLALVVFWSQFADWGIGDSIYPYACARAAPSQSDVSDCELWCNELSLGAQLAGTALSAAVDIDSATLLAPTAAYSLAFIILAVAAASDLGLGVSSVVLLVAFLRLSGPYIRNLVPRFIQPNYPPHLHNALPAYFGFVGIVGNLAGSALATGLITSRLLK